MTDPVLPTTLAAQWTWWSTLDRVHILIAMAFLLVVALAFPATMRLAWRSLAALPTTERSVALGFCLLGMALRLVAPERLVMIFSAYRQTEDVAAAIAIPKYGAGTFVLHRLAFAVAAPDHSLVVDVHRWCAVLALPLWLALLARLQPPPGAVGHAAWLVACLPLLVRDAATESNLLPALLWLAAGLVQFDHALTSGRARYLWLASCCGGLAAMARPELPIMVPVLVVAWLVLRRPQPAPGWRIVAAPALVLGVAIALQVEHLLSAAASDIATGALPPLGWGAFGDVVAALSAAAPLQPQLVPVAVAGFGLWAALDGVHSRRTARVLLTVALVWMALPALDLPEPSIPRLHAPAVLLLTLTAALAIAQFSRLSFRIGAVALCCLTALPTLPQVTADTNENDADLFVRRAFAALPASGACLIYLSAGDQPPPHKTQRAQPLYLLRPPHRDVTAVDHATWRRAGHPQCANSTFLLVDHRCWAAHANGRNGSTATVMGVGCQSLLSAHRWTAVLEQQAVNHGDNAYGYWGDGPAFALGLYRLNL